MSKEDIMKSVNELSCLQDVDELELDSVKKTIAGIMQFENAMPKLTFAIDPKMGHYMMSVRGWSSEFSQRKFHNVFLHEKRNFEFDNIMDVYCQPELDSKDGPMLRFKLSRAHAPPTTSSAHRGERYVKRKKKKKRKKKRKEYDLAPSRNKFF